MEVVMSEFSFQNPSQYRVQIEKKITESKCHRRYWSHIMGLADQRPRRLTHYTTHLRSFSHFLRCVGEPVGYLTRTIDLSPSLNWSGGVSFPKNINIYIGMEVVDVGMIYGNSWWQREGWWGTPNPPPQDHFYTQNWNPCHPWKPLTHTART